MRRRNLPRTMGPTTISRRVSVTIYQQVRGLLADGQWHNERELEELVTFPEEWIAELQHAGDAVVAEIEGERLIRLAGPDELHESV
jgi:hypothetical protein